MNKRKTDKMKERSEVKTYQVPFSLGEIKENIVDNATPSKISKEQIINKAFGFHSQGNISEAAKYYQYFIDQGFTDPRVFSNYGIILKDLGNLNEAEISQRKAIELNPNFAEAHSNLGNILKDLGKLKEAEISYSKAVKINPNFANAYFNLGNVLRDLGNLKEAELSYKKAIKIKPHFADAYSHLGNVLLDLGNLKEAELSTRRAIEINPNFAEAYNNLGNLLKDLGKLKEAELSQRKAIKLNPDFAFAHYNLGISLKELGKLKEAEISQRKAIELNPNFAEAYSHLGNILRDLGKLEEAKNKWLKAIKLKPSLISPTKEIATQLYLNGEYQLAINYLKENNSDDCQSLYLSCLLCLDREKEFNQKYNELSAKNICNADMSAIIEHANIIYNKRNQSFFCNEAIKYVMVEKINEQLFSENHCNQLISYLKTNDIETRPQLLIHEASQTSGNLFSLEYPFIKSLKKALELKIELYKANYKDSDQGFIKNWPKDFILNAWILSMKTGGFIKQHNHRYGWITGSFYLQVPKSFKNNDAGNISFSYQGPEYPSKGKKFNSTIKKIETRDICIFPSSLYHQTIPFEGTKERICLVFDLLKKH